MNLTLRWLRAFFLDELQIAQLQWFHVYMSKFGLLPHLLRSGFILWGSEMGVEAATCIIIQLELLTLHIFVTRCFQYRLCILPVLQRREGLCFLL